MLKLILVRHGETERNAEHRLQGGKSDTLLNVRGEEQARCLGLALRNEKLLAIYCSPLRRALSTARAIGSHHGLEPVPVSGLEELDMGLLDGHNLEEVKASQLDFWRRWRQGDYAAGLPGGESPLQVRERAWQSLQGIAARHTEGSVAVVSHSITLQTVITAALGAPLQIFPRFSLGVASITVLRLDGDHTSLVMLNDTCHLEDARFKIQD